LTPLVGREQELEALAGLHRQAAESQGAIALLVGDAGVGKSRLLYEFLHRLETGGVLDLETTCASYGRSMAYRPIVELLRRYLGLAEVSSDEEIRSRVTEQLQFLGLAGEERSILLTHFLGVSAPPEFLNRLSSAQLKVRLLGVLRDVFLGASELVPLILIVENMHWIDSASEEFLAHLAADLPGHRVLLVLTTRPGYTAAWLAAPLAQTITLAGLGTGDVQGMVRTLLAAEEVSAPLCQLLADKSEGNPLYVEEILRQLQETGGIAVENGEAQLSRTDVTVPATIHDIIAARIDRIAEPLKQTLQGAAVVGRRFGISLVSRVLQVVPEQVAENLRDLHALDFVFPSAQAPELMYSFKHALTQDVIYEGVLERRRRRYHAAAGLGLEELYAGRTDEVMELLAYHFGRSAEAEKAVDFAILAAEKTQRRWANTEALAYFEDALQRVETMPDTEPNRLRRIDAVVKQAETMFALGRHAEHVKALEAIRPLTEGADPPRRAAWLSWAGFLHSLTGTRSEVSIAYCREAAALADAAGLADMRAFAESCLAHVCLAAGDLHDGLKAGERALGVFEARGNLWWACRTFWALIPLANALGDYQRALDYCDRALAHATTMDDARLKVVAHMRRGSTEIQRGDVERGLRACQQAAVLSAGPFDAMMLKAMRAAGLMKTSDVEGGVAELAEAVAWFERSGLQYTRAVYGLRLADGYRHLGDRARARALAEEVLVTTRERGYRHLEGRAERALGESLSSEDPSAAAAHLESAARIFADIDARNDLAEVWVAQAELHEQAGDVVGTKALLERALAVFEELGTLDEAIHTRTALLQLSSPA
jgi:tetratricopeptide (TPR) repeat protein